MPQLQPQQIVARPSSSLVQHSPGAKSNGSATPARLKEIVVTYPGVYRIKFAIRETSGTGTPRAQVYRNGSPIGTVQEATPGSPQFTTFSEDIGGWKPGDLLQLYAWNNGIGPVTEVMSFSQWGEFALRPPDIPGGEITLA